MNKLLIILLLLVSQCFLFTKATAGFRTGNQNSDTTVTLFNDPGYQLHLQVIDSLENETYNAILTVTQKLSSVAKIIFVDSLYCKKPDIQFKDFNNDRVRDVLIFNMYDVRSNVMYYLYVVDQKSKRLIRVKGFEDVKNPELNPKENVITSFVVSGTDRYSFYRINKKNKLVDLNKTFQCFHDGRDSVNYQKMIRQIRKIKQY